MKLVRDTEGVAHEEPQETTFDPFRVCEAHDETSSTQEKVVQTLFKVEGAAIYSPPHRAHQRLQVRDASTGETIVSHFTLTLFIVHSTEAWLRSKRSFGAPASTMKSLPCAV